MKSKKSSTLVPKLVSKSDINANAWFTPACTSTRLTPDSEANTLEKTSLSALPLTFSASRKALWVELESFTSSTAKLTFPGVFKNVPRAATKPLYWLPSTEVCP